MQSCCTVAFVVPNYVQKVPLLFNRLDFSQDFRISFVNFRVLFSFLTFVAQNK